MQQSFSWVLRQGFQNSWRFSKRHFFRSPARLANPVAAVERHDDGKLNNETIINDKLSQSHQLTSANSGSDAATLPLLESLQQSKSASSVDLSSAGKGNLTEELAVDKSPLPFEEIPGPAILKLWEKYWRYVPLFGTQLFRSALVNRLTEGNLSWNRNVTPMRYLFNRYGPVVRINGPFTGNIVLIHRYQKLSDQKLKVAQVEAKYNIVNLKFDLDTRPEHIAKVFEEENETSTRSGIDILQYYRQHHRKYRFSGPFCAQGAQAVEWIEIKKSLNAPIGEEVNKQFGKLEMACEELLLRIQQIRNRQDEVPNTFNSELSRWGMECFWVLMLNKRMGFLESTSYNESSEASRFIDALSTAHLYMSRCETGFQVWRFIETPFSNKLFTSCDVLDSIIGKYIRIVQNNIRGDSSMTREEDKGIRSSVLEFLLSKQRMNPDDVSTLLMDMIILGVQATSNSEAFLLYYLAKNPRVQKTLLDEITSKVKPGTVLRKKTLDDMPYLDACIKECLRLRQPFPYITRLLSQSITLHGYNIPKGAYVIMANQISSCREENFEDPQKFKPERWLETNSESFSVNSYLPFGKGLRSCMGEDMAKLKMKLLTAKIVREFRIEYDYADIESSFLMMSVPNRALRFRFVDRS